MKRKNETGRISSKTEAFFLELAQNFKSNNIDYTKMNNLDILCYYDSVKRTLKNESSRYNLNYSIVAFKKILVDTYTPGLLQNQNFKSNFINNVKNLKGGDYIDIRLFEDGTYEVISKTSTPIVAIEEEKLVKVPRYTIFIESADDFIITVGLYKGVALDDLEASMVEKLGFAPKDGKKSWAQNMLQKNISLGLDRHNALTEDDINVLNKIIAGRL